MLVAHRDFLTQVRSIERTVDLTERLIAFAQVAPRHLNHEGAMLRQTVRKMGVAGLQPGLDGAILLLAAAFEKFVGDVIMEFATALPNVVPVYRDLPNAVRSANERLTGLALNGSRSRFSDYELRSFVDNLRGCHVGSTPYVLNGAAMALNQRNVTSTVLRELIGRLGISEVWDQLGATTTLKRWSGRGGAKVAISRAQNQLNELMRNRNQIAHGVAHTTLGAEVIRNYMRFERALARSLVIALERYEASLVKG